LLDELLQRATVPEAIHSHAWLQHDVVIWDNRSALHRATAYDSVRYRRLMQRTTIGNPGILDTPIYKRIRELQQDASTPAQQAVR
jgi:alpha-ketoglutarate-dependent taurine dioxygenase